MCEARNRFLFEIRPDIAPWGWLTDYETALWSEHYRSKHANG